MRYKSNSVNTVSHAIIFFFYFLIFLFLSLSFLGEIFTLVFAEGFQMTCQWQQVSLGVQISTQYSSRP